MKENKNVVPFDSFSAIYKILFWAGYSKLDKQSKVWKRILYEIYRRLAITIVIVYNMQSLIYTYQARDDIKKMTESLTLGIPYINLFVKCLTLFILNTRLQKLNEFLKGKYQSQEGFKIFNLIPLAKQLRLIWFLSIQVLTISIMQTSLIPSFVDGIFCVTNEVDHKILQRNVMQMHSLCRILNINTTMVVFFWGFCSILRRYINGESDVVPMYIPYRTDTAFRFSLLLLNQIGPVLWVGNGHTSIDILITTYYAQAITQLKIIRQQLNNLVDETLHNNDYLEYEFQYKDLFDKSIKERFVSVLKRHETLMWYVKEVDSIFNVSLSIQFFTSAGAVCFVVYGMTTASTIFQFIFMMLLFIILTTQIFLYCIFGNFVFTESQLLNDYLYESDWLSLSPSFRRQLLIAMVMWSQPVQPKVCRILRLSLSTFLSIIKASYSLYTVLITTNIGD